MKSELDQFINLLGDILKQGNPFPEEKVAAEILINPMAGVIKNRRKLRQVNRELIIWQKGNSRETPENSMNIQFHITKSMDHAQRKALSLIERFSEDRWAQRKILILAGGDGFHKDICTAIVASSPTTLKNLCILRLPMGTGNDGCDCQSISEACEILSGPSRVVPRNFLKVNAAGMTTDYCFNIVSFGIDAYICELTEKWKRRIPGDIFKVMVDFSVLFYDLKYPIKESRVSWTGPKGSFHSDGKKLLLLMGPRGKTSYGGHKKILPDSRNFLFTDNISVFKRILVKEKFMKGTHLDQPGSHLHQAHSITVDYDGFLLMELDGEVIPLEPDNFPVKISLTENALQTLQL